MKKRNEPTIVEKAFQTVPGFERVYKTLHQQLQAYGLWLTVLFPPHRR